MEIGDSSVGIDSKSFPSLEIPPPPLAAHAHSALEDSSSQQEIVVPSGRRPRKMKSLVWNHFVKLVINGQEKAKCLHCQRVFSGNSKNGTSHLKNHMTRRCVIRFSQAASRQKLLTFNHRQDSTGKLGSHGHGNANDQAGLEHSPVFLDEENEHMLSTPDRTMAVVGEEAFVGTPCHSPLCVDGGNQCIEQESGGLSNMVVKATYKEDTVRFNFLPTSSSVDELEKEVAKNLKLESTKFKIKYQDEDKEWMLMTMDSHLDYVLYLCKSSGCKIVRLLITDL